MQPLFANDSWGGSINLGQHIEICFGCEKIDTPYAILNHHCEPLAEHQSWLVVSCYLWFLGRKVVLS